MDGLLKKSQGPTVQRICLTLPPQPWQEDSEQALCILALASYQRHEEWESKDLPNGCKIHDPRCKLEANIQIYMPFCFIFKGWGEIRLPTSGLLSKSTFLVILNLDETFSKCCFPFLNLWGKLDTSFRRAAFGHE